MNKEWVINEWEMDWDNNNMYYEITEDGKIRKYDVENDLMFEYKIERVAH